MENDEINEIKQIITSAKPRKGVRVVSAKDIETEDCPSGGKHRVFMSLCGFNYAQFCTNEGCNTVSNEYPPDINWEDI